MKGVFVTFEGGDGAGKTTLIEKMALQLQQLGKSIIKTREPGGTSLGEEIRKILLTPRETSLSPYAELCLFLASRSQHIQEVIAPALHQGKVVLCDRFNDSSVVYQGMARGLGMDKVSKICDFMSEGLHPHVTLYLDIAPEIGLKRAQDHHKQDRIESETIDFHQKIRVGYLTIAQREPNRFHLLDASQSPDIVFNQAMQFIQAYV